MSDSTGTRTAAPPDPSSGNYLRNPHSYTYRPPRPTPDAPRSAPVENFYFDFETEAWFLNDHLVASEDFPNIALIGISEDLLNYFNSRISGPEASASFLAFLSANGSQALPRISGAYQDADDDGNPMFDDDGSPTMVTTDANGNILYRDPEYPEFFGAVPRQHLWHKIEVVI